MSREEKKTEMTASGYEKEILDVIRSKNSPRVIRDRLQDYHANDIATVLPELEKRERLSLYRIMRTEDLAEMLEYADEDAEEYLNEMDPKKASTVLEEMEPATAADILKNSDSQQKRAWLELMDPESRKSIQVLASYTMKEAQVENLVTAKGYKECVAIMGDDGISVVVSTDSGELTEADVAKITDIAVSETGLPVSDVKIMAAN